MRKKELILQRYLNIQNLNKFLNEFDFTTVKPKLNKNPLKKNQYPVFAVPERYGCQVLQLTGYDFTVELS
jgi:hypothetical protein